MAEVLSGRGRNTQARGSAAAPRVEAAETENSSRARRTPGEFPSTGSNGGGAGAAQGGGPRLLAAGGPLWRPSRLQLGTSKQASQDPTAGSTLPPLSPVSSFAAGGGGHMVKRSASGSSVNRALAIGGSMTAATKPEATAASGGAPAVTGLHSRISPGGSGGGARGNGGGRGLSLMATGTERRQTAVVAAGATATLTAADRSRGVAAGGGGATGTAKAVSGSAAGATARPSVRLARGSAAAVATGSGHRPGRRVGGPVAGPGSAAARAAEGRAAAAAAAMLEAAASDGEGDTGSTDFELGGDVSYRGDVGTGSGGGSSGGGGVGAGNQLLSRSGDHAARLLAGISAGSVSASPAASSSQFHALRPSSSSSLRLPPSPLPVSPTQLHAPPAPRATSPPRPATAAAGAPTVECAGVGTGSRLSYESSSRPLSDRRSDGAAAARPNPSPPQSAPQSQPHSQPRASCGDPLGLGLGIGPLSIFGPLAPAPPAAATSHHISSASLTSRPTSASLRPAATADALAQGGAAERAGVRTLSSRPGSAGGAVAGSVRPPGRAGAEARRPVSRSPRAAAAAVSSSALATMSAAAEPAPGASGPRMQAAAARAAARASGRAALPSATIAPSSAAAAAAGRGPSGSSGTARAAAAAARGGGSGGTTANTSAAAADNRTRAAAGGGAASSSAGRAAAARGAHVPIGREEARQATGAEDAVAAGAGAAGTAAGRRNSTEASGGGTVPGASAFAAFNSHLDLLVARDTSPLSHPSGGSGADGAAAAAASRRRSSNGPGAPATAAVVPMRGPAFGSRAAADVVRMLYDRTPFSSDDNESFDDGDDSGSESGSAVRHGAAPRMAAPLQHRLFRVQVNPAAEAATTFGPTRFTGPSRPPLPPGHLPQALQAPLHHHQHQYHHQPQHQSLQQQQGRLRRRTSDSDDGVVGGSALALGSGGGFQERFLADLRRRDAQRSALMQLLSVGGEEELMRQLEEEQLALALMLSLQEADGGGGGGASARGGGAAAAAGGAAPRTITVRLAPGSFPLLGIGLGMGMGGVVAAAASAAVTAAVEPHLSYEELLALEDVKVTTPQAVLDALPCSTFDGSGTAPDGACAICQCDYEPGEALLCLPCAHVLHATCARKWLGEYSKKCPVCKQEVC